MFFMNEIHKFASIWVSYLKKAPDHGQPEVAVVYPQRRRGSVVPVAVGEQARALWEAGLEEAEWKALAEAERVQASIRKRRSLTDIKNKLAAALTQAYKATPEGLDRAIRKELDPGEQQLALENLKELRDSLLKTGEPEDVVVEVADPVAALQRAFKDYVRSTRNEGVAATLQGSQLAVRNWRDLLHGVAQAYVLLRREDELQRTNRLHMSVDELRKQKSGKPYPASAYRKLSNGKFFFVHGRADKSQRLLEELLTWLGVLQGVLEVEYDGKQVRLPSKAATAPRR